VQTDLLGSNNEPRAMPLAEFIDETMRVLGTDAEEVLVERAKPLRNNAGPNEAAFCESIQQYDGEPELTRSRVWGPSHDGRADRRGFNKQSSAISIEMAIPGNSLS